MSSPSLRGTLTYLHAFHGFLGAPGDWRPIAERLEADFQVLEAKAPVGLMPLTPPATSQLEDSPDLLSPIRLVAWDIESILERHHCMTWGAWVEAFHRELLWRFPELARGGKAERTAANGTLPSKIRHALLGYSLGGRLALPLLLSPLPAFAEPADAAGAGTVRKRRNGKGGRARVPWRRAIFISTHPGLRTTQEKSARMASDLQWMDRLKTQVPFEKVLRDWNSQPVLATSHAEPPSRRELGRLSLTNPKRQLFSDQVEHFSLGTQDDHRESLRAFGLQNPVEPKILWVAGERDRKYVSVLHDLGESQVPGEFWMCSDAGHRVPWDNPVDFAARLRAFLT